MRRPRENASKLAATRSDRMLTSANQSSQVTKRESRSILILGHFIDLAFHSAHDKIPDRRKQRIERQSQARGQARPHFAFGFFDCANHRTGDARDRLTPIGASERLNPARTKRFGDVEEIGCGADRVDAGDGDLFVAQFDAHRFGNRKLRGLGGRVNAEERQPAPSGRGGDDHHLAAETVLRALFHHHGNGGADAIERAQNIRPKNVDHLLRCRFMHGGGKAVAGVGDKRIDPAELFLGGEDQALAILLAPHIGRYAKMLPAELLIQFGQFFSASRRQHELRAARMKFNRKLFTNPRRRAGDDDDHAGDLSSHARIIRMLRDDASLVESMFTGLVETSAAVAAVSDRPRLRRLVVAYSAGDIKLGESIAINGVCLTVVEKSADAVSFDVISETLDKTNLGQLRAGDLVHIERAIRIGDRLDGHFVQGHVDGTARLLEKTERGEDWRLRIEIPKALAKFFAPKGSICVDGVSLTIADLSDDWFEVALIPATLAITQLGKREAGYAFNLECDMIGKTVVRYLELYRA